MADALKRHYWDTTCFICFLNRNETQRRLICEDILRNARDGEVLLYTSTFTITEVLYPKRSSVVNPRRLSSNEASKIADMFRWKWLRKLDLDQRVAYRAAEIARDHNLLPSDAIHAATAILHGCDVLQNWDRDFSKVAHLIRVENPARISAQSAFRDMLANVGPTPDDFARP